jgi:hypothetical protein
MRGLPAPLVEPSAIVGSSEIEEPGVRLRSSEQAPAVWDEFLRCTRSGARGLWIGRVFPVRLRAEPGSGDVRFLWLSEAGRANSVSPRALESVTARAVHAMLREDVRVVLFEEIEYFAILHGEAAIRTLLGTLDQAARSHGARVLVLFDPTLLPPASTSDLPKTYFAS